MSFDSSSSLQHSLRVFQPQLPLAPTLGVHHLSAENHYRRASLPHWLTGTVRARPRVLSPGVALARASPSATGSWWRTHHAAFRQSPMRTLMGMVFGRRLRSSPSVAETPPPSYSNVISIICHSLFYISPTFSPSSDVFHRSETTACSAGVGDG